MSCKSTNTKIGVIDLPVVYNSFDYQVELDNQFKKISEIYSLRKDSIQKVVSQEQFNINNSEISQDDKDIMIERIYIDYMEKSKQIDFQADSIANSFTNRIWKQLNSYIRDYGEDNDYDLLIGMQGDGNVMYTKEQVNVTDDVIEYINIKYNGQ